MRMIFVEEEAKQQGDAEKPRKCPPGRSLDLQGGIAAPGVPVI
jgi:hypothetical protein